MELIRAWILGLTGAALLSGVVLALTPKGKWAAILTMLCGFMLLSMLISPAMRLDLEKLSRSIVEYKAQVGAYGEVLQEENQRLMAEIIEREAAEYIWDKAVQLDAGLEQVTVVTRLQEDSYPYPYAAQLTGVEQGPVRDALAELLEGELGIAKERQTWN